MSTWKISCQSCGHHWAMTGNWSVYGREQIESRPCPCCGCYTLSSPEPTPPKPRKWRLGAFAANLSIRQAA